MSLKKLLSKSGKKVQQYGEGGLNLVGRGLNALTGSTAMLDSEYSNNVALWNMQNEYNTPSAQIARMKAAGIDVNPMTYAVGNGSMSTTASNVSAPSVGASGVNPIATLMSVLSGIKSIEAQGLQNQMLAKDLDFYEKNGYRPGTSDWMTILPALIERFIKSNPGVPGSSLINVPSGKFKDSEFLNRPILDRNGRRIYDPRVPGGYLRVKDVVA